MLLVAVEDRESEKLQGKLGRLQVDDEAFFLARLKPLCTVVDAVDEIGKIWKVIRGRVADDKSGSAVGKSTLRLCPILAFWRIR